MSVKLELTEKTCEFRVWTQDVEPHLGDVSSKAHDLIEYIFTETVNNAMEHSGFRRLEIRLEPREDTVSVTVWDDGNGIFRTIAQGVGLHSDFEAAVDLTKGKLTTSPETHSGEGLFFSMRAAQALEIASGGLVLRSALQKRAEIWSSIALEKTGQTIEGTRVRFTVERRPDYSLCDVFDRYTGMDSVHGIHQFDTCEIHLGLVARHENLVSRSQARRLLSRCDQFSKVLVIGHGVDIMRQAFADELFRVWPAKHADVEVIPVGFSGKAKAMIGYVIRTHQRFSEPHGDESQGPR